MKISVITISYNQSEYLSACIESVASQEGPLEHIIVDPGSTDNSRAIIRKYQNHFSKVVFEPDNGPADGLNKGFKFASGEIFYYLNSDDIVLPGTFEKVRKLFIAWPDIDVISGGAYVIDENGIKNRRLWSDPVNRLGLANGGSLLIQPSTFFRRTAFLKTTGFNPENLSNWDGELVVDMFDAGARFRQVNQALSGYRVHKESITGSAKLNSRIQEYGRRMYTRLTGREPGFEARVLTQFFRILRIARHPSIITQRLIHGRIYGGYKK